MPRTLLTALVAMIVGTLAVWLALRAFRNAAEPRQVVYPTTQPGRMPDIPAFAASDKCVACHQRETPAIVAQWAVSKHAAERHTCGACHVVKPDHPMAVWHENDYIMGIKRPDGTAAAVVTPSMCAPCHEKEVKEFAASRHSLPAWAAMSGTDDFKHVPALLAAYEAIEEIPRKAAQPNQPLGEPLPSRNALYDIEGPQVTPTACERCHQIGKPWPMDDPPSAGRCSSCHSRHDFAIEQVRKPETCNNCHIGPDHPQFEIYMESKHGIQYATKGDRWNWSAKPGTLTTLDFSAATCALCHMSGFGPAPTTHDVGDRLSWFLYDKISIARPNAQANRERMQSVCAQCHSRSFILDEYRKDDMLLGRVNELVSQGAGIMKELTDRGLVGDPNSFSKPIHFTAFNLWHHWGRTAKFGAFMQGADYTQWHGVYPLLEELAKLKKEADDLKKESGKPGN